MELRTCTKKIREATAITISGTTRVRYTNEKTTTAHAVNPRLAVSTLGTEPFLLRREQDVDDDEHRERQHQADCEGRAERLILGLGELIADQVAHELELPAPQDVGDD